jgi:endonuclease/exonuclease/phosphatase (EEP) superfamily protein YafD
VIRYLRPALKLTAAAAIAAWVAPFAGELWWPLELPSHFRVQHAVVFLALVPVFAALRERRWLAATLVALAVAASPLAPYWPGDAAPSVARVHAATAEGAADGGGTGASVEPPRRPVRLKVMTANVWYRDLPAEPLLETIRAESPDVIVLQEYTRRWAQRLAPLDADYPHSIKRPRGGAYGIGVLSRHELSGAPFRLSSTAAIEARLRVDGRELALIAVHLRAPTSVGGARDGRAQLALLAMRRAQIAGPLLIAGDFNNTPFAPSLSRWLDATGLQDPRRQFGHGVSWPTFLPILGIPIDHLFVSEHMRVTDFRRLPSIGSDHYPVIAEILLQ